MLAVFPDWIGAVLNGTGAIDWWIHEFELWYRKIKVRCSLISVVSVHGLQKRANFAV